MLQEFLILSAVALYLAYRWSMANSDFFAKRGVPYHKPFPMFGSMKDVVFRKRSMFDEIIKLYNMHDGSVYGIFDQRQPLLLIRNPNMVKQITIKDFDHFVNHRTVFGDKENGNLFASSLFAMQDATWKDMRTTLSPAFTGNKMRQMFQLMNQVAEDSVEYLKKDGNVNTKQGLELDMKDYCTRFTNDIIASTAFGLQMNSFENKNNEFFLMGKKLTNFTAWQGFKFMLWMCFKGLIKFFKMEPFDRKITNYFRHLVLDAMKYRKEHNIFRPDMINLLMEARGMVKSDNPKSHSRDWSDTEIVAQCFLFFFAGFDTASVLICFAAHELMENPETQQKLLQEIENVSNELNGKPVSYEALQGMKYMDMVTSEVLRKWPPAATIGRVCNKDFVYEADGERIEIKQGDNIWMPVCAFHRDERYFANPNKFDPERFSDENKDKLGLYMPFGLGPRICIASRFALLEAKAILFYLLREFRIELAKKTTMPMELSASNFQLMPKTGFWLKFVSRKQS